MITWEVDRMNHLIIYSSKYGAVEKCAKLIKDKLEGNTKMVNLKTEPVPSLEGYDTVLLGGGVYAGKIQDELKKYSQSHKDELCKRKLGVFILCKDEGEKAQEYIQNNFSKPIVIHASVIKHLGHEINLEKMNFIEKTLLKTLFKIKKSYSKLNQNAINELADKMNKM